MATLQGSFTANTICIQSETTNGSTVFTDSSGNSKAITVAGSVAHSTTRAKFGSSSIHFTGAGDLLTCSPGSSYTNKRIDLWIYIPSLPASSVDIIPSNAAGTCYLRLGTDGVLTFQWFCAGCSLQAAAPIGEWFHLYLYKNAEMQYVYDGGSPPSVIASYYDCNIAIAINGAYSTDYAQAIQMWQGISFERVDVSDPSTISIGNMDCDMEEIFFSDHDDVGESFTPLTDPYPQSTKYIYGVVFKGTSYVSRNVCAYDQSTDELIGTSMSDESTGVFTIINIPDSVELVRLICEKSEDEEESLIIDDVVPGQ